MIKINQTRFGEGKGNCFASCVCCILEIEDPESVPNFCFAVPEKEDWWAFFVSWLKKNHQLDAKFTFTSDEDEETILSGRWNNKIKPPFIISGHNHEGIMHSVVYCPDNTIWNTNRTCKGLVDVVDIIYFVPGIKK